MGLRTEDLAKMKEAEKKKALSDLAEHAAQPRNGQLKHINDRIQEFEVRYEMTSDDMRKKFALGEIKDTADIAVWLMLISVRDT